VRIGAYDSKRRAPDHPKLMARGKQHHTAKQQHTTLSGAIGHSRGRVQRPLLSLSVMFRECFIRPRKAWEMATLRARNQEHQASTG